MIWKAKVKKHFDGHLWIRFSNTYGCFGSDAHNWLWTSLKLFLYNYFHTKSCGHPKVLFLIKSNVDGHLEFFFKWTNIFYGVAFQNKNVCVYLWTSYQLMDTCEWEICVHKSL